MALTVKEGDVNAAVQLLLLVTVTVYVLAELTVPEVALVGLTPADHE